MSEIHKIMVPNLGEGIRTVDIVNILVRPGSYVEEDSGLVEIETEKATYEIPSPVTGCVSGIFCKKGQKMDVRDIIMEIREGGTVQDNHRARDQEGRGVSAESYTADTNEKVLPPQQIELIARLEESQRVVVPATIERQIDWERIVDIRRSYRNCKQMEKVPSRLEIVAYAIARSMFVSEKFRTRLHRNNKTETSKDSVIGISISMPGDVLVTPAVTVKEGDSIHQVFYNIRRVIDTCRYEEKFPPPQYRSVDISCMISHGVIRATPVVVYPAVATVFVGAPYYTMDKRGEPVKVCSLVLTFDHRLINGAYAAKFLSEIDRQIDLLWRNKKEQA